jgi:hypothetical protein
MKKTEELKNLSANQTIWFNHKNATNQKFDPHKHYQSTMFADATAKLGIDYQHVENEYEDFKKGNTPPS